VCGGLGQAEAPALHQIGDREARNLVSQPVQQHNALLAARVCQAMIMASSKKFKV
jgi:hypothetical protein